MKTKITILMMFVALFTNMKAQNVWYDINFSSTEWLDAVTAGTGTDPRVTAPITWTGEKTIGVLKIDGNFVKDAAPIVSRSGKEGLQFATRLRNTTANTYIEFPEIANAGKITVYVQNNATDKDDALILQKNVDGTWTNLQTWPVPRKAVSPDPAYDGQYGDLELSYNINSNGPVTLRLTRDLVAGAFMKIYYIVIEKYSGTSVQSPSSDKIGISVNGKTLSLSGNVNNAGLSVFDLTGKQVFNCKVNSDKIDLRSINSGVYIVKLIAEQGVVTQKVVI